MNILPSIGHLLVVGSWLFWTWLVLESLCILRSINSDDWYGWSATGLVTFFVAFWSSIFSSVTLKEGLVYGAIYLVAGAIWSFIKWISRVKTSISDFKDASPDLANKLQLQNPSSDVQRELSLSSDVNKLKLDISPSRNKSKIICWLAYWPLSIFWDCTVDLFKNLYRYLQDGYKMISVHYLKKSGLNIKL